MKNNSRIDTKTILERKFSTMIISNEIAPKQGEDIINDDVKVAKILNNVYIYFIMSICFAESTTTILDKIFETK